MYRFTQFEGLCAVGLAPLLLAAATYAPHPKGSNPVSNNSSECQLAAMHAVVQLAHANPALHAAAFPQHPGFSVTSNPGTSGLFVSVSDLEGRRAHRSLFQVHLDSECRPLSVMPVRSVF